MSAPPGLLAAAFLLWGFAIGLPWLGAAAGAAVEAARLAAAGAAAGRLVRPALRACTLLALAWLAYAIATQPLPQSLYGWLRWLPLVLLPLPALQLAGAPVRVGTLGPLDLTHAHAAVSVAAAGTGSGAQAWFYPAAAALAAWALLARAPRRRRAAAAFLAMLATALGFGAHVALAALQEQVEEWSTELIADFMSGKADPFRERTRIGDLGRIKLSDRIVMRVATPTRHAEPILLREAAFDRYHAGEWQSARRTGTAVPRIEDAWVLGEGAGTARLALRRTLAGGQGLLPLPQGTRTITRLPAESVEAFATGAVRVRGAPRFIAIDVHYDPLADTAPPASPDLQVPEILAPMLAGVLSRERLRRDSGEATLGAVRGFFDAHFSYSLNLGEARRGAAGRTVADFLTRDRRGHCEYFATATVLLLRAAGIPARYVGGYSVQEWSPLEGAYVVRARHAHAWAQAWLDGRWVAVDTTPARWAELEQEAARGPFAPLLDRLSWLWDRLLLAWEEVSAEGLAMPAASAAAVLAIALLGFLGLRRWKRRAARPALAAPDRLLQAWRAVEARLAHAGYPRDARETPLQWAHRLQEAARAEPWRTGLASLVRAYYRARFDPSAPDAAREFEALARAWPGPARR